MFGAYLGTVCFECSNIVFCAHMMSFRPPRKVQWSVGMLECDGIVVGFERENSVAAGKSHDLQANASWLKSSLLSSLETHGLSREIRQ